MGTHHGSVVRVKPRKVLPCRINKNATDRIALRGVFSVRAITLFSRSNVEPRGKPDWDAGQWLSRSFLLIPTEPFIVRLASLTFHQTHD
jgi:hypothetical protein